MPRNQGQSLAVNWPSLDESELLAFEESPCAAGYSNLLATLQAILSTMEAEQSTPEESAASQAFELDEEPEAELKLPASGSDDSDELA